jgi:IS30 family transposase
MQQKYYFSVSMVRRRISEAQKWQIIGMHTTGMSFKAIGRQIGYHYAVVTRLVRKHTNQQCERLAKIRQTTDNI